MYSKKNIFYTILSFLILTIFIVFGTYQYIINKQENLLNSIYYSTNTNILKLTQSFFVYLKHTIL